MDARQQLSHLLERAAGSQAQNALAALNASPHAVTFTRPVPIKQVRDIYRFRARRNAQTGNPISGFSDLMVNLEAWPYASVVISSLPTRDGTLIVFTDADVACLAGILETQRTVHQEAEGVSAAPTAVQS